MKKRVILIVLDSVGIGALPDAADFGDAGANTLGNIYKVRGRLDIPNMVSMGIGDITGSLLPKCDTPIGAYGKCAERTHAKDTTCGHWEISGLALDQAFKTFPNGFPREFMDKFEKAVGRGTLGNCVASGTEIIQRLGDEHVATGKLIIYTSADSVFQIAAHEDVVPLEELYHICETARAMLTGDYMVGRVIARPFVGANGEYTRTENRRDYALAPFKDTILDGLTKDGLEVIGVGKIEDIFCHRGISVTNHTKNNFTGIAATEEYIRSGEGDFVFVNLVDTDMLYGHRNNVEGYAGALEYFDGHLESMLKDLREGDILMITADHGCDPTYPGTDHTREYIPLLIAGQGVKAGVNLGIRSTFADIGSTVYDYLTGKTWREGSSFLKDIEK
ncbi:MAG TPA: phosphopentomutase [Eubacteriales bacterium]|nr:phosphopentomutase [Clostridia bacterium]HRV72714.1 phosphopentomutase [Eubacteriales bacterium]